MTQYIRLRVEVVGDDDSDVPAPHSIQCGPGSSVIDVLRNAQQHDSRYTFTSRVIKGFGTVVTSFCGIFNDPDSNLFWFFYSPASHCIDKALSKFKVSSGTEIVARYEKFDRERDDQRKQSGVDS